MYHPTSSFARLSVIVCSVAIVCGGITLPAPPAVAAPWAGRIDTTDMAAVRDAYLHVYLPAIKVGNGWTGDGASCNAGRASAAAREAAITVINYYRALDGLAPVSENAAATRTAQQTALMMFVNNTLSHNPSTTWTCYSDAGGTAAGESNLALGYATAGQSIDGYMDDGGPMPQEVGHRSWILYPPQSQVGVGIAGNGAGSGYAIQLWGQDGMQNNSRPASGTPWPAPGYFPFQNLPSQYWSYAEPGRDFGSARVAVTKNGKPLATSGVTQTTGFGDPKAFWTMPKLTRPARGTSDKYIVTLSGVRGGHAATVTYAVQVFNAAEALPAGMTPSCHGCFGDDCRQAAVCQRHAGHWWWWP